MTNDQPKEAFPGQTLMTYQMITDLDETKGTVRTLR